jgi:hypothetical protein
LALDAKLELSLWRGSVICLGKLAGIHNSIFLRASSKEKAEKFVSQRIRKFYRAKGISDVQFKVWISSASDDEAAFFSANAWNKQYSGLIN